MSVLGVLNAERIKLATTGSSVWITVAVAALSLALAALQGALAHSSSPVEPVRAALGIAVFGVPVLMVLASMTMTAEYRSGMIRTTFVAAPNRTLVLCAKTGVVAVFSAVYAGLLVVASLAVARLCAPSAASVDLAISSPDVWRVAGSVALYAALAATLGVAVGALLRAGPGSVAALLLWPLVVEPMVGNLPDVGPEIGPYLPFANIFVVTQVPWLYPAYAMPWGPSESLAYFAAVVAIMFGVAVAAVNMRDS